MVVNIYVVGVEELCIFEGDGEKKVVRVIKLCEIKEDIILSCWNVIVYKKFNSGYKKINCCCWRY